MIKDICVKTELCNVERVNAFLQGQERGKNVVVTNSIQYYTRGSSQDNQVRKRNTSIQIGKKK